MKRGRTRLFPAHATIRVTVGPYQKLQDINVALGCGDPLRWLTPLIGLGLGLGLGIHCAG